MHHNAHGKAPGTADTREARRHRHVVQRAFGWASMGLLGWALVKELRTPREERTWQGRIGPIPYDLRIATPSRLREAYWAPEDSRLFLPRPMGVGWSVNVGRLVRLAKSRM